MKLINRIEGVLNNIIVKIFISDEEITDIYDFYCSFDNYRTVFACSEVTGISEKKCKMVEQYLIRNRKIGSYVFEKKSPPQKYMANYITRKFTSINYDTKILEIGPGDNPLFDEKKYSNWIGLDKGYQMTNLGSTIMFHNYIWGRGKYDKLYEGSWESISEDCHKIGYKDKFDLVCGSHSFEHCMKPISALRESAKVLKKGGILVLFVPDGYSLNPANKDYTHTIYLTPPMIDEFFNIADCYENVEVEVFRPNLDYVITAIKK